MVSNKQKIFAWFYKKSFSSRVFRFETILRDAAKNALQLGQLDSEAFIVNNLNTYWNYLLENQENDIKKRRQPLFKIVNKSRKTVQWLPHYISIQKSKVFSESIKARPQIYQKICLLNEQLYENASCIACRAIGAKHVHLTPRSAEGGIDFFASFENITKNHIFWNRIGSFRIIGQSKFYSEKAGVGLLRDFIASIEDVYKRNTEILKIIPNWFIESDGPIIGWLIAHSGFQSGVIGKAKSHGIILSDSIDISEVFALSNFLSRKKTPLSRSILCDSLIRRYQQ